ncbi:MAG: hypothetical protein ACYC4N_12790, partial [Pirellulaceae bacterium]
MDVAASKNEGQERRPRTKAKNEGQERRQGRIAQRLRSNTDWGSSGELVYPYPWGWMTRLHFGSCLERRRRWVMG